jgi:hypothetical protein
MKQNNPQQYYQQQNFPQQKPVPKQVPVLVKVIAVFGWIGSAIMILMGLAFLVIGIFSLNSGVDSIAGNEGLGGIFAFLGAFALIGGIFMLAFGIFYIFVARGLWKGKNWARIVQIIVACLGIIYSIWGVINQQYSLIVSLIINGLIAGYFIFSKKVKEAFS